MTGFGIADRRTPKTIALITAFFLLSFYLSCVPVQVSCQTLTSTLHSTEYGLKFAYDGEEIRFTCVVEGNSIAWSSDEYIGSDGNRLEFVSIEHTGTEYRAGQTVAILVNVSNVNGLTILESQLQISVRSAFQISSIRCHNIGSDTVNTISFETNGNASITCNELSACPGETVRCTCITGYSNTLAWSSNLLIGPNDARLEFVSIDPINMTLKVPGSNTSAMLTNISRLNGVVVLFSDLTFVIESPANILTCVNVGQQRSYSMIVPMSKTCSPVSTASLPTTSATSDLTTFAGFTVLSSSRSDNMNNVIIGVSVFLCIIIVIISSLAILMLMIIIIHTRRVCKRVSNLDRADTQICSLKQVDGDQGKSSTLQDINNSEEAESECTKQDTAQEKSTNAVSMGAELKVKPGVHISQESNPSKLQQSKLEGGATGWVQFSEEESKKPNENEIIPDVHMMALVAALDTQKEMFKEIQERSGKKKFVDTLMNDVFENTRNNSEDTTGGLRKRAQADKDSKEE